jgi:cell division topological specificity factor
MSFLKSLFNSKTKESASIAKERLQIVIKKDNGNNPILNVIEDDIIDAIKKYIAIDPMKVSTNVEEHIDIMHVNAEVEDKKVEPKADSSIISRFFKKKNNAASIAKERLQIIVRKDQGVPKFGKALEQDIKDIIMRYVKNNPSNIGINFDFDDDGKEFLELDITLPESFKNI